jgi:hypothetical protein
VEWAQTIFNVVVPFVGAIFGWLMKSLWDANKELRADLTALRVHIPETYIPRLEFDRFSERLFDKLDKIEQLLHNKADK